MARIKAKPSSHGNRIASITQLNIGVQNCLKNLDGVTMNTSPIPQAVHSYIDQGPGVTPAGPPVPPPQHPQATRLFYTTNGGPAQYTPVNYAANLQVYVSTYFINNFHFLTRK